MSEYILFSTTTELIRVPGDAIVHIVAQGNYSVITMADSSKYVLTMQLGQVERRITEMVSDNDNRFVRIGKSLIINQNYITFINPSRQKLILSDCRCFKHEVSASREALKSLKEFIEKSTKK